METAFVAGIALAVAAALVGERRGDMRITAPAKLIASALFIALAAVRSDGSAYAATMLTGFALSAVGDGMLLARRSKAWFLAGLGAFLFAHVAYAVAFIGIRGTGPQSLALWLLPFVGLATLVGWWLKPHVSSRMALPVAAYILAICTMMATATLAGGPWMIPVGAFLFGASDLAVARQRFITETWWNRAIGLPLYYGGQVLLAWSVGVA